MFAPLLKRVLSEERMKYPIVLDYRMVDNVGKKPTQSTSMAVISNGGSGINSKSSLRTSAAQ